ncbi:MAG: type II secretion system protein [Thermoguttaceae bacterium]
MRVRRDLPARRQAFTLVELLTVIVIIGILAGLVTAVAIRARAKAKEAAVRTEIAQLETALEAYKFKYGEYPPDFTFVSHQDPSLRGIGRKAILRHLRSTFPRYLPPDDGAAWKRFSDDLRNYYHFDPGALDPAAALVFWLGGLPEVLPGPGEKWGPAGFHADPQNPFKPGQPRTEPFFDFSADRLAPWNPGPESFRFTPPYIDGAPYVYFRARRDTTSGRFEYGIATGSTPETFAVCQCQHGSNGTCVPYLQRPWSIGGPEPWYQPKKYQIITAGMDNVFGDMRLLRVLPSGDLSNFDLDNITNFAPGRLEDEIR